MRAQVCFPRCVKLSSGDVSAWVALAEMREGMPSLEIAMPQVDSGKRK